MNKFDQHQSNSKLERYQKSSYLLVIAIKLKHTVEAALRKLMQKTQVEA